MSEIELIQAKDTEPCLLFEDVKTDFYDRLNELSKDELIELKTTFISKQWYEYVVAIENEINKQ